MNYHNTDVIVTAYKSDMDKDISGDCRGDFGDLIMALCKTEREPGSEVNREQAKKDAQELYKVHFTLNTIKFLNFGTPEIFAVIYLKFKQRGQALGYSAKKMQME